MSTPITLEEFWQKLELRPSQNSREHKLVFDGSTLNIGSAMRMKLQGDELLERMIARGEVIMST